MERNSFKEYSVLAMVSKEEQRPIKACYNFFSPRSRHCLTRRSSHGHTSRRLGKKITELLPQSQTLNKNINSKLSLRDLDEKMTSAR